MAAHEESSWTAFKHFIFPHTVSIPQSSPNLKGLCIRKPKETQNCISEWTSRITQSSSNDKEFCPWHLKLLYFPLTGQIIHVLQPHLPSLASSSLAIPVRCLPALSSQFGIILQLCLPDLQHCGRLPVQVTKNRPAGMDTAYPGLLEPGDSLL